MYRSAIILAGGFSSRLGQDKGLLQLADKPLVRHVLDLIAPVVSESLVVVSSRSQVENYLKVIDSSVNVFVDVEDLQSPLVGALTGFRHSHGEYSILLPCDTPLISRDILSFLFEVAINKDAVIPRWPNGNIEPLQAIYRTKTALDAAAKALRDGKLDMRSMVDGLRSIRYVSTLALEQLDPGLWTFFNINTPLDLKKAERMLKRLNSW
ncbi:MAG: molybdenum cofactor guanylyltransferase [Candidatus Bathyarchaeia archaeon]